MKSSSRASQKSSRFEGGERLGLPLKKKLLRNALVPDFIRPYTNCQLMGLALRFHEDDLINCYFTFL
jgi:hypothetical protein